MSAIGYPSSIGHAPARRARPSRLRAAGRLETLAVAAGICLPVPVFAVTGLSIPLPNVVERIAAALVPWADGVMLAEAELPTGASGSIIEAATDALPPRASAAVPGVTAATPSSPRHRPVPARVAASTPTVAKPSRVADAGSRPDASGVATAVLAPTTGSGEPDRSVDAMPSAGGGPPATHPGARSTPANPPASPPVNPPALSSDEKIPAPPPAPEPTPASTNPLPLPIPTVPSAPVPLPAPVEEALGGIGEVAADPVGAAGGVVGGIVPAPGGTVPLPLPGLGKK